MYIAKSLPDLIGQTPLLELSRLFPDSKARILAKLEIFNPMSIKDRPVINIIRTEISKGNITASTEVVEASSGNTAIAIASLGAVMGFRVRIFLSEACSIERLKILSAFGAKVVVTPAKEHTKGARKRAMEYCKKSPRTSYFLNQHGNEENGRAHEITTGPELWEQTNGEIDAIVIGLGTGGTFDGLSRFMKGKNPKIKIVGFEPETSPVFAGGAQGQHKIIGVGPGFITDNFRRSQDNLDALIHVPDETAYQTTRLIALKEGLIVGVTSGASAWVAGKLSKDPDYEGKTIICFFYDTGERYLSTPDLFYEGNIENCE